MKEVMKLIEDRIKLNIIRRRIFNGCIEGNVGKEILTAKEMLGYEDRFLKELLMFVSEVKEEQK